MLLLLGGLALAMAPAGAATTAPAPSAAGRPAAELSSADAIILGVIEGVTEFLPISSTGHLIVATNVLGLESEKPLTDAAGQPLWHLKPSARHPQGVPLTLKLAADTYTVVIQFGAIAAVLLLYRRQVASMFRGLLGRDVAGLRLLVNLIVAFIPAAVIGLLLHGWVDEHLFSIGAVVAAQVAGAFLMLYAEHWRRRRLMYAGGAREPADLGVTSAAKIGLLQCVALWPGTSRSMMTITGGYFCGLDPRRAAEFSFLLGFVTLTAASAFKSWQSGASMIAVFGWPHVVLGAVVAAVSAAAAVRFLVGWLTRHGLGAFAVYRLVTAAAIAAWFFF
ncbi:MAG TPA: undecaprenyl-diphosphate phosphatase [Opitutaceae bacterium]|nr:undecaprenyl-diphosphate phosphatase [Opitutaceae bacterium]